MRLSAHAGLWLMMCQCESTSSNNCATVVEDVCNVGGCVCAEVVRWEISVPPTRFSCGPKTALLNK